MTFFSDLVDTFSQVIFAFVSVVSSSDFLVFFFPALIACCSITVMIRFISYLVCDETFSFSFLDWIKEKFQRDGKSSDKAENMDLIHTVEDYEPFVRSIKIVNVLLDRVMFEYVGDYAISERKDTMTIYYSENGEARQFSFKKSSHIEVYEDVVE